MGCRTRRNMTFSFHDQHTHSLSGLYHEMSGILLLTCHHVSIPPPFTKSGVREDEVLINFTLLWTKSSQSDCIFVTSQTNLWCVCMVCVCECFYYDYLVSEWVQYATYLLTRVSQDGSVQHTEQEGRENRILATAGRESKPAEKAVDCGGTGIVTIVSIHIINSQLLYLAFRRKRKTACSGSPASPLL